MGRGRQKAKQTKVARALKYHTASIDVTALQHELSGGRGDRDHDDRYAGSYDDGDAEDDQYASYADDDDESDYASPSRGR